MHSAPDYLNPKIPNNTTRFRVPVVAATNENLQGYGHLVTNADDVDIEIVRWPSTGARRVDIDSGNEGGTVAGEFECEWHGDVLYGRNNAVGGHYVLGYATDPQQARQDHTRSPRKILLWHANYHPDGGQLFFPLDARPFVVPLALPGDDISPDRFVCFHFDGTQGLYIHPNIWHEAVFALSGKQRFFDRQGAVHARISVDFPAEFGCVLEVPLDHLV